MLRNRFDVILGFGAASSVIGGQVPWSSLEWILRLAFAGTVAVRSVIALRRYFEPNRIALLLLAGLFLLLISGPVCYWLQPRVHSYSEGLWLAFESSAAVGYGDIAPTTPASRVFAVFTVLLGYGMLSLSFAALAAAFVGHEERILRQEMHRNIKALRGEISALRRQFEAASNATSSDRIDSRKSTE